MADKQDSETPKASGNHVDDSVEVLSNYIYEQLNTPAARRARYLRALSEKNPVIKVRWTKNKFNNTNRGK